MADSQTVLCWTTETVCAHALEDARVVRVTGDDARTWLNGQTTNDIREVGTDEAVYALSVNVKGRIQADLWVVAEGEGLAFVAPASATEALLEALDRYIIMEDVELLADESLAVLSLQGPLANEVAASELAGLRQYRTARLGAGGVDVWVPQSERDAVLTRVTGAAETRGGGRADGPAWATAHVAAGIPRYGDDFGAETYPQEAGLKRRAVSFNKGCYLGQEVICMLENRGKLSRRLALLQGWPGSSARPGEVCANERGAKVGQVTSVSDDDPQLALAFLKRGYDTPDGTLRIGSGTWTVTRIVGADD